MARPREFDERAVLDAIILRFWKMGYEATSMRDLIDTTGLTSASLYNAFGDKRSIFRQALERYVETTINHRIRRCESLAPREAIAAFFSAIISISLEDQDRKGCMLINSVTDRAPHDLTALDFINSTLRRIETFFSDAIRLGQAQGTVGVSLAPEALAKHLLGILIGVRSLARVQPNAATLNAVVAPALAFLVPSTV